MRAHPYAHVRMCELVSVGEHVNVNVTVHVNVNVTVSVNVNV